MHHDTVQELRGPLAARLVVAPGYASAPLAAGGDQCGLRRAGLPRGSLVKHGGFHGTQWAEPGYIN